MRRLLPLVLVLAACTSATGDTTTVPLAEPSTTTTTAPSTTTSTTEPTTTTTVEECVERDGVLRNRRGFVCPPHLMPIEFVELNLTATNIYLPGTYESRLFHPRVRFTRTESFMSSGERPERR